MSNMLYQKLLVGADSYYFHVGRSHAFELHCHPEIELSYCYRGSYNIIADDREYTLSQGELFIVNPLVPHELGSRVTEDCLCLTIDATKDQMGSALGRTSVAMAAVTDIGFAEALVKKLSAMDEGRYGAAAEQLSVKAKRAAERKAEKLQHEKNVQQGKKRKKETEQKPAEKVAAEPAAPRKATAAKSGSKNSRSCGRGKPAALKTEANRFAGSRPVKKGKGSFKKTK
jgi:hypothetical protein